MDRLRDPEDGCPWDLQQTFRTIAPYTIEEAHEVADAIERNDLTHLKDELGDLLFQVVFHATIAAESGSFTLADVARGIHDKLHRRHPHVFGVRGGRPDGADEVVRSWEQIKREEKGRSSVMDGIPAGLPSLLYAHKVLSKAEHLGAPVPGSRDPDGELGEALLGLVAHARATGVDAEAALRAAADAVRRRAQRAEADGDVTR